MGNQWRSLALLSWVQLTTVVSGGWLWTVAALCSCRSLLPRAYIPPQMSSGPWVYIYIAQRRQLWLMGQVWVDFEGQTFCSGGRCDCVWLRKPLFSYGAGAALAFFCCTTRGEQWVLLCVLRWWEVLHGHQGGLLLAAFSPGQGSSPLGFQGAKNHSTVETWRNGFECLSYLLPFCLSAYVHAHD